MFMSDTPQMGITQEQDAFQSVQTYNANTQAEILNTEILHSYFNHAQIWSDIKSGRAKIATDEKCSGPAMIIGSGPSLEDALPIISEWKGAIFCSSSQAATICHYGHDPEYIVMLDPRTRAEELFDIDHWEGRKSAMVTHPGMAPQTLAYWPNRKIYFRVMEPNTSFYTEVLPVGYHFINCILFLFSCSLSAQIGLARLMGYDPLILVGCDFAAGRFRKWSYDRTVKPHIEDGEMKSEKGKWVQEAREDPWAPTGVRERLVIANNGVLTERVQLFYKRSLACVLRLDKPNLIHCSPPGRSIVHELPYVPVREVVACQGRNLEHYYLSKNELIDRMEIYLGSQNTWVIPIREGIRYFESPDPKASLKPYIAQFKSQGVEMDEKAIVDRVDWLLSRIAEIYPRRVLDDKGREGRDSLTGRIQTTIDQPGNIGNADAGAVSDRTAGEVRQSGDNGNGGEGAGEPRVEASGEENGD